MVAGVFGNLLGLLVGLQHVGEKDVHGRIRLNETGEVVEDVVEAADVLGLDELNEVRIAHASLGRVNTPSGHAGGDRGA